MELYNLAPEHHLLRKIHRLVDFSFIHVLLFRLLFLQILYNFSDERVIQEAISLSCSTEFTFILERVKRRTPISDAQAIGRKR